MDSSIKGVCPAHGAITQYCSYLLYLPRFGFLPHVHVWSCVSMAWCSRIGCRVKGSIIDVLALVPLSYLLICSEFKRARWSLELFFG